MKGSGARGSRTKFGIAILVALTAVTALALVITGSTGIFFPGRMHVRAYFENAAGVRIGSPVHLDGVTIGSVRGIHLVSHPAATPVEITMEISSRYRDDLLTDSRANLSSTGVLGNTVVDIDNIDAHGKPLKNNGVLPMGSAPSLQQTLESFQDTTQKFGTTLNQVNTLMSDVSGTKGTIGRFINDTTLSKHAAKAADTFGSIAQHLSEGRGTVGKFMKNDSLSNHLKDMASKVNDMKAGVEQGQGSVGKFVKDHALKKNLKEDSRRVQEIASEAKSGPGAVALMVGNADFKKKLHDTRQQISAVAAEAKSGKGTIGLFATDPSLGNHMSTVLSDSQQLVTGFRKHPLKYVRIRFRLF